MSAIIRSEMITRRKAVSLMGLAAAFGLRRPLPYWLYLTPKPRQLVWSGVRRGVTSGISGVTTAARGVPTDVRSGAQVRLRARLQRVQLPAQLSNSIGPGRRHYRTNRTSHRADRNGERRPLASALDEFFKLPSC